jgi:uncharacterized protein (TIGR03437 family)
MVLAVLVLRTCWAQAPDYTAADIVNASDYSAGPFAPNSVLTVFGSNLSWYTASFGASGSTATVPTSLSGVQVFVDITPAPLLYVSSSQVNFLVPSGAGTGTVAIRVVREGITGPIATVVLIGSAPALFDTGTGFAIATHLDGSLLTEASPAHAGEIVVVYATGLGATDPNPEPGEIPTAAAIIQSVASLRISLDGAPLPPGLLYYAGATPDSAGLYQLNIQLPQDIAADPAIQIAIGVKSSSAGLRIPVQ